MILLPKVAMKPRYFDPRVGYFATGYTDFDVNPQGVRANQDDHKVEAGAKTRGCR